jgi:hypothetical protein
MLMGNGHSHLARIAFRKGHLLGLLATFTLAPLSALSQTPTGTVGGAVVDSSGAALGQARVTASRPENGARRSVLTDDDGHYLLTSLDPDTYEIVVERSGFTDAHKSMTVRVGDHLTVDFVLEVAGPTERVDVASGATAVNTIDYRVAGSVTRSQIEAVPLNGRSFLELAQLQPSVQVVSVTNPGALGNNFQQVLLGGAYFSQTRITIDGSTVGDRFVGGTTQGLSQESVQEFQVSTFNFDAAAGTGSGAINIVTRQGTNAFHGSAFLYYRDHHLAAYPGLSRDPRSPDSPFFARRQSGASAGGPLIRDRLFWFANYERNNQDAVFAVSNNHPVFSKFDGIYPNPLDGHQVNVRLDGRATDNLHLFVRYSLDRNKTVTPAVTVGLPSNWETIKNNAFQLQAGATSVMRPTLLNELRVSFSQLDGAIDTIAAADCRDRVACVGVEQPFVTVFDAPQFRIGKQFSSPFDRLQGNFQIVDTVSWQRGSHYVRAGGEWEHFWINALWALREPAQITLWGPTNLQTPAFQALYDALPASLRSSGGPPPTFDEIMQLPLRNFATGIGDPTLPGPFNRDSASRNNRFRLHVQDTWRVRPNVSLNYGLAYTVDTNLFNHDLDYPRYLAPIFGDTNLGAPGRDWNDWDPSAGVAWTVGPERRTVLRAGAGRFTDESIFFWTARDRAYVGPSGNGRVVVDGSLTPFDFTSAPTGFRGVDLLAALPAIRSGLAAHAGDGTDLSVRGIDVFKQADQIVAPNATTAYSIHLNAGIQRQLGQNVVLTADYVLRRYRDVGPLQGIYSIDRNRFNRPRVMSVDPNTGVVSFVRDPIIPQCTTAQARALDPSDVCSTGPIFVFESGAKFFYQGLHVTLDKRLSSRTQLSVGYALSENTGFIDTGVVGGGFTSYDNPDLAYGNIPDHRRHRLVISGTWMLPDYAGSGRFLRGLFSSWSVSFVSYTYSAPPLDTLLTGLDLDGDGISQTLLPGTSRHNTFGDGLTEAQLRALVSQYNASIEAATRRISNPDGTTTVVRPRTPFNQVMNPIVLPDTISPGDPFVSQDVRVTKDVQIGRGLKLALMGEVFNVFNISNLTGYSGVLNQPNYGQPSARVGQVFGTGGSRAAQLAARVTF